MSKYKYKKLDKKKLIELSKKGDCKALEELIRQVQRDVFSMFSYLVDKRQDISDLTQEALLKMAKNISSLKNIDKFKAWLNQICTNVFYDYLREKTKIDNVDFDNNKLLEIRDKIGCEPGEKCLVAEIEKIIKAALLSLPSNLRIVLVLREFEGLSYQDISKITHIAIGTVKSRISRARIKMQDQLKDFV